MIFGSLMLISIFWSMVHSNERAVLEIVMHRITRNGEYKTEVQKIFGHYSAAGPTVSAEGDILQVGFYLCTLDHPVYVSLRCVYFMYTVILLSGWRCLSTN